MLLAILPLTVAVTLMANVAANEKRKLNKPSSLAVSPAVAAATAARMLLCKYL
jgi:hypothetical protein